VTGKWDSFAAIGSAGIGLFVYYLLTGNCDWQSSISLTIAALGTLGIKWGNPLDASYGPTRTPSAEE